MTEEKKDNYRKPILKKAFQDVIYLIERGYHKNSSINFVTAQYQLNKLEKNIIFRTSAPLKLRDEFLKKKVPSLKNKEVAIDGFNILITVEKILEGSNLLFKSLDTFLRDVAGVYGRYSENELTFQGMNLIIASLVKLEVKKTVFLIDSVVSHSGELAAKFRKLNPDHLVWEARTSRYVDTEILDYDTVLSHDAEVVKDAKEIFDLPLWILKQQAPQAAYTDVSNWLSEDFLRAL
ncbi:MAG: DUF434 domain-containing protein [Promethearchaeota archaeon]